jgi:hypothetical protein
MLKPETPPPETVASTVRDLTTSYLEADFLHCLVLSHEAAAQIQTLVVAGKRQAASDAGTMGAACLAAVGELDRARQAITRLLCLDLPEPTTLNITRPDFRLLFQTESRMQGNRGRFPLLVKSVPLAANLFVDGRPLACEQRPCQVELKSGEHFVSATGLGYRTTSLVVKVDGPTSVTVTLDPASAREASSQWSSNLAAGESAVSPGMLRAAALAAEADVSVGVVAATPNNFTAALYDRRRDKIVSKGQAPSARSAVRIAIVAWQDQNKPPLVSGATWLWGSASVALISAGLTAYFLMRDTSTRYDLVFPTAP